MQRQIVDNSGIKRQSSVRTMTPCKSCDTSDKSLDGFLGSKFAERDDESRDCVRSNRAHSAINDTTQTLANICLKCDL